MNDPEEGNQIIDEDYAESFFTKRKFFLNLFLRLTDDQYAENIGDYGGDMDLANILEYLQDSEWTDYFSDSTQNTFDIIIWDL